jgi:hypothetical protein
MMMLDFPLLKWIIVCTNWLIFAFLIILICEHYYAGNSLKVSIGMLKYHFSLHIVL